MEGRAGEKRDECDVSFILCRFMHRLRGGKLACLVVCCGPYHRTVDLLWVWVLGPRVPVRSPVVLVCGLTR